MTYVRPVDDEELVRRFKAALAYAGLSVPQLAERVTTEPNLSASTLYDVQQQRRNRTPLLSPGERAAVAAACGLPVEFFTADFSSLRETTEAERLDHIEQTLTVLASALSLEQLDADEAQALRRWQSDQPSEASGRGSQSREAK